MLANKKCIIIKSSRIPPIILPQPQIWWRKQWRIINTVTHLQPIIGSIVQMVLRQWSRLRVSTFFFCKKIDGSRKNAVFIKCAKYELNEPLGEFSSISMTLETRFKRHRILKTITQCKCWSGFLDKTFYLQ